MNNEVTDKAKLLKISMQYRTKDGLAYYHFSFEEQSDGTRRAYLVQKPDYCGRSESAYSTHLNLCGDGRDYIDWPDPKAMNSKYNGSYPTKVPNAT